MNSRYKKRLLLCLQELDRGKQSCKRRKFYSFTVKFFWVDLMSKKKSISLFIRNWGNRFVGNFLVITQMNPARNQLSGSRVFRLCSEENCRTGHKNDGGTGDEARALCHKAMGVQTRQCRTK